MSINKLGLDIHGVLDTNPVDFIHIAKEIKNEGGEVHVITGSSYNIELETFLLNLSGGDKFWDELVSIQDELIKTVKPEGINSHGRPYWFDKDWDRVKGDYCRDNNIDLHYDDTERYIEYFTTPVILYSGKVQK